MSKQYEINGRFGPFLKNQNHSIYWGRLEFENLYVKKIDFKKTEIHCAFQFFYVHCITLMSVFIEIVACYKR